MSPGETSLIQLIDEIFAVNGGLLAAGDALTAPYGLSAAQWQVLGFLKDHPGTAAEVARRRGLRRQSVQETVNRLLRAGLLTRQPNPHDARAPLLVPTERAQHLLEQIERDRDRWEAGIGAALSAEEISNALGALRTLRSVLGVPPRAEPQGAPAPVGTRLRRDP